MLDRVQVWGIFRQEENLRSRLADGAPEQLVDELRAFVQAGVTLSPPFAHPGVDITR
jgi:hypothetical protein